MTETNPNEIDLFKRNSNGELNTAASEVMQSLTRLTDANASNIRPNQRIISHQLFTEKVDDLWNEKIGVKVTLQRKLPSLNSVFLVNSPHSGTHFFATRFNRLSYTPLKLADYAHIDYSQFPEFMTGGYFAQKHLPPNIYNKTLLGLLLRENGKVVMHFRDPRSVLVSALFLMFKKMTPEEVYLDSLRWGAEPIPLDFIDWDFNKKVDFYYENYFQTKCLEFVNEWFDFSKSLPKSLGDDNLLISDFSLLRKDPRKLFRGVADFLGLDSKKLARLPEKFWDKKISNSHFRRGLLDEWKEVCSPNQIKKMSNLIHDDCYNFFGWERF